jgi:hypothetical protein
MAGHFSKHLLIPHVRRKSALASHGLAQRVNLAGLVHCLIGRIYKSMFLIVRISTLQLAVSAGKQPFDKHGASGPLGQAELLRISISDPLFAACWQHPKSRGRAWTAQ